MHLLKTRQLSSSQNQQINQLWDNEYPVNLQGRFGLLLEGVETYQHYLLQDEHLHLLAWAVTFYKDNEMRFSLAVQSTHQGQGLGKLLVDAMKLDHHTLFGWVIDHNNDKKQNGETYTSPLNFYSKLGFEILPACRIDLPILQAVKIKWVKQGR